MIKEDFEDEIMGVLIIEGATNEFVDVEEFLRSILN